MTGRRPVSQSARDDERKRRELIEKTIKEEAERKRREREAQVRRERELLRKHGY
jgi:hypothetical protein